MVMRDDMENVAELELLRTQRAQLASRLKTPWWYVAATAFAWAGGWLELQTWSMSGRYGPSMRFLKPTVREDIVLRFIANNFDAGTAVLATDDRFGKFISLARDHKDALAAQEYKRLTDASLAECHLATTYARDLA